jgi:hypothetical protein
MRDGDGVWEAWPEVDGKTIRRIVYLYSKETLAAEASGFKYLKEGFLELRLLEENWRSHIFQRAD